MKRRIRIKVAKRWCAENGIDYRGRAGINELMKWNGSPWQRWERRHQLIEDLERAAGYLKRNR
jgi:hypothetical protein